MKNTMELFSDFQMAMEGFVPKPEDCPNGYPTIGFGHKIRRGEDFTSVTPAEAVDLFNTDFAEHRMEAQFIPEYNQCSYLRQLVLAAMVFQMGRGSVLGFSNMRKAILANDWTKVQYEMLNSRWYNDPVEGTPGRALITASIMYWNDPGAIPILPIACIEEVKDD